MNDMIIGIDLGTSTTEAAVFQDGIPVMITNMENEQITPSAVGIDEAGNFVIGERARAQYMLAPERTAIEIKRKIGTGEKLTLGKQSYTAVELSAKLLEYIKTYASERLGTEIDRAVISVPAYFDEIQRQATVMAGRMAGLQVERILNEPTAAALSYGLEHMEEESHILVYDLGGGTFDVTLLEMFDGVLEVKASSGDNQLGGKDFDEKLMEHLENAFREKNGVGLRQDPYAAVRLKEEAEKCKKVLSTEESCHVLVPMIIEKDGKPLALDEVITREQFEEMTRELIMRTHEPMELVLADGEVMADDIDRVILVGGSTRMPIVAQDIENYLGIRPVQAVNPDYAVAEGAAIQAGIISGAIDPKDSILMTDVNPYTLGVRCADMFSEDCMSVVIPRNVTIPTSKEEIYSTYGDYQTGADIEVYQGESSIATSNHFLGKFEITGIPPKRAGEEKIRVVFHYNLNGMLEVEAFVVSTGESARIEINMLKEQETEAVVDVSNWKGSVYAKQFRTVIRRAEKVMGQAKQAGENDLQQELEQKLYLLKKALIEEEPELARELEIDLLDLLEEE